MAASPLVTIITVVLNQPAKLEATLKSISSQTYLNKELIVIDGGSMEAGQAVLKKHTQTITHLVSEPDKGIYDAMNKGLALANGDWVQFINAGDEYKDKESLATFLASANTSTSLVYSDLYLRNEKGIQEKKQKKIYSKGLFTNVCHQTVLYNRAKLNMLNFRTEYEVSADFDLLMEIYFFDEESFAVKIDDPLIVYEQGGFSDQNLGQALQERTLQFQHHLKNPVIQKLNLLNLKRQQIKHQNSQ